MDKFQALVARQNDDRIDTAVETLEESELPAGEVTIRVAYSSVNYKDALAADTQGRCGARLSDRARHRPDR